MRIFLATIRKIWYDIHVGKINGGIMDTIEKIVEASSAVLVDTISKKKFRDIMIEEIEKTDNNTIERIAKIVISGYTK